MSRRRACGALIGAVLALSLFSSERTPAAEGGTSAMYADLPGVKL
jgi:hypothetical protein